MSIKMHCYTVYLSLETALGVSGGSSTHHQEHLQLCVQHLAQVPDAVHTVVCAPDDWWSYHPKHVGQFPEINKLCNVGSCWIYVRLGKSNINIGLNVFEILQQMICCHIYG